MSGEGSYHREIDLDDSKKAAEDWVARYQTAL